MNDALPLKAAQRDATANVNCFGARGHQRPIFDGFIYTRYAAPPYSAGTSAIYLLPFGKVSLGSICWPCTKPDDKVECRLYGWWVKEAVPF